MTFSQEITAITVNYNSKKVIDNCLKSVEAIEKIVVVDNASQDGSMAEIIPVSYTHLTLPTILLV